ncbi:dynein heavy chain [Rhizophagus irregularis DAOM 181602=DAOM 197198]|nr:dynein heavy chain [Rhizophagus irregularis DAOM 181602=DAOM 197198]
MDVDTETSQGETIAGGPTTTSLVTPCEPNQLQDYFDKLLPLVLGAESSDLANSLWSRRDDKKEEDEQATFTYSYICTQEITYNSNNVASVAFIKYVPTLDGSRAIQTQIQLINLPGPASSDSGSTGISPYEALHSYIHLAVAPYFDAYARARERDANEGLINIGGKKHDDSKIDIPMVKKKITELELSLLLSQQNVEIPEISLNIHPVVQKTVEECREKGKRVTVDMIENQALLTDSTFLNKLQADVNGWIKEIKKVTKLSRDPASGTAIQEINFWLSMEKALEGIDEQLKGDHIELTLGILRHAKRYHTTVSFIADTGLKESKEKVNKYNQLMKDFPLDELLSAPDVNKIKESLDIIFTHLKKLRLSTYPIKKALVLVEAISRDLNDQLLRVLGNRGLMYMEYEDFEKIMSGAEDVFKTWDENIKEFKDIARDVTRKRSDKFIPIKISPAHDKLQERVAFVRNFRKQHEQLHPTIVKVINSMEEVKLAYESVKDIDVLDVSIEVYYWVDNVKGGAERIVDNDGIINYLIILLKHGPNSSNYIGNSRYSKLAAANEY